MVRRTLSDEEVEAIVTAARREDVLAAMDTFYAELDATIAAHQPVCLLRGACCHFEEYGHNLFVTTLEAAYFVARAAGPSSSTLPDAQPRAAVPHGCLYQISGRCTARRGRPMGCRVFFCDPQTRHWQGPLTEEALGRLRKLHDDLAVPYVYAEWRDVLRALDL